MPYLALILGVFAVASFVIVKKFRKKELVGLDVDVVMENVPKIKVEDILRSMDSHTVGVIVSFFDQRHGPIPILQEPEILSDNFEKLVELSDLSFSAARFVGNFEEEIFTSFDFNIDERLRVNNITYAYSLNRPDARGGAENITLNILVQKEVFQLVSQFTSIFLKNVHEIHELMDKSPQSKEKVKELVKKVRMLVSAVVLSYVDIYGTTELVVAEPPE